MPVNLDASYRGGMTTYERYGADHYRRITRGGVRRARFNEKEKAAGPRPPRFPTTEEQDMRSELIEAPLDRLAPYVLSGRTEKDDVAMERRCRVCHGAGHEPRTWKPALPHLQRFGAGADGGRGAADVVRTEALGRAMNIAYADPPYVGQARKHYDYDEVDHAELIDRLVNEFPDGWALSCSSPSLRSLLPLCPENVRIAAWVKPFCIYKPNVNPAYAWEPVIFSGGRKRERHQPTSRDWVSANVTLKRGLVGAKPEGFSLWLFALMGMDPSRDTLHDLFPGTGAVGAAWTELGGSTA